MSTAPQCRLHLYFARDTGQTVILRRETDQFEDGQWLKHKVYPERCDLSPDGRHFLYFALDGRWSSDTKGSYTAISHPPYFTAIALFPQGDTWGGGGVFLDNKRFVADGDKDIFGGGTGLTRLYRSKPDVDCPSGLRTAKGVCVKMKKAQAERVFDRKPLDHPDMSNYHTKGGKLFRRRGQELNLIRDFSDMQFEPLLAPYDTRPRENAGSAQKPWHPLDMEDR